ncbi:MAG: LytTR family DNA-binding domain-containing protein [Oscillospiraceae bacterium]|nr:LytTR family DNA-binding domain-containing protein [Oscillospiraceae bacterium]
MRIALCDDNEQLRKELSTLLAKIEDWFILYDLEESESGEALIIKHIKNPYNIIFLDIEMDGMSGIETGHAIRKTDKDVIIIFLTSHTQYVFESFTIEAFDYIVKPITAERVRETLGRALRKYKDQHHIISFRWQGTTHSFDISDIVYIEAYHGRVLFRSKDDVQECNGKLEEYERDLRSHGFLRCHRNAIINMRYIKSIEDKAIITTCNRKVEMSARKKQSCLRAYNSYLVKYRV